MQRCEEKFVVRKPWTRVQGLIAAPFTPMNVDYSLNLDMIPQLASSLINDDVAGAFVCGTTGEGVSLSLQERMAVTEAWVKAAAGKLRVIAHVGHTCTDEAARLANHAQSIGVDAIASMAPSFFRPENARALADYCAVIALAADQTPFFYYHIPSMTNVSIPASEFLKEARTIPTLAGVKYTHFDLMDLSLCMQMESGRYEVLYGRDETLLAGLSLGTRGAVGSTYNFAAQIYQRLMSSFTAGDLEDARRQQRLAVDVISLFSLYGGLPTQKAIMKMIGVDCGPVRLPLRDLSPDQYQDIFQRLDKLGFFSIRNSANATA